MKGATMQPLEIGAVVEVTATAKVYYDEKEVRQIRAVPCEPFQAFVTGKRRKFLGVFDGGGRRASWNGFDDDPPYLRVTGSVLLWCVRRNVLAAERLVRDEDLKPCSPPS